MGGGMFGGGGRFSGSAEEMTSPIRDWPLLCRVLRLLTPYWRGVLASVLSALGSTGLQILNPLVISLVIDVYFLRRSPRVVFFNRWLPTNPLHGLALLSSIYLAVLLLSLGCESMQAYLAQWTGQKAMADLRRQLVTHLHRLHIAFYDSTPVGRLVTRVTTDVEALSDLFSNGIVSILANIGMTVFFLLAMFRVNSRLSLVLAAILPVFIALTVVFRRMITKSQQRVRILLARINSFIAEHVNGITVVQLFNRQEASLEQFDQLNSQHMAASKQWVAANAWFLPTIELMGMISQAGLLLTGSYLLNGGRVTIGTLVAFLQYGNRFLRPIQEVSERYGVLQTSLVSAQKVFVLLDTPVPEDTGKVAGTAPPVVLRRKAASRSETIEFDHVWFAYREPQWVLRDVSFRVEPGQTLAIVGHTGAGKTTLANLLLRFYEPQRGLIRLGQTGVHDLHLPDLRKRFGIVLQDSFMREGSILENIRFGSEELTDAQVLRAANEIGLGDMVRRMPEGFATLLHERGEDLSAGQKQLIAFARALAHDPQYLILDEATSNVDTETESRIQQALARLLRDRTSIVIAHRLSTVMNADRIMAMHKGAIAETGTHAELMARRGIYWKLCQLQFGGGAFERGARSATDLESAPAARQRGLGLTLQPMP